MPRRLQGFAAMGDSVAAMNPVYGHGMTLAFVAAQKFREAIVAHIASGGVGVLGLGSRFQQSLEPTIDAAWALSTASDFRVPGVEVNGKPYTYEPTEQSEYMERVLALATEDADLALKYMETALLMRGPEWVRDEDLRARVNADWDRLGSVAREP
jgi:flavin-dependent dehydrogenase